MPPAGGVGAAGECTPVFFDIETNSLADNAFILQISCSIDKPDGSRAVFCRYISCPVRISEEVSNINNITAATLANAEPEHVVLPLFWQFVLEHAGARPLMIGWNSMSFDMPILLRRMAAIEKERPGTVDPAMFEAVYCGDAMLACKKVLPQNWVRNWKQVTVYQKLTGEAPAGLHTADGDVRALQRIVAHPVYGAAILASCKKHRRLMQSINDPFSRAPLESAMPALASDSPVVVTRPMKADTSIKAEYLGPIRELVDAFGVIEPVLFDCVHVLLKMAATAIEEKQRAVDAAMYPEEKKHAEAELLKESLYWAADVKNGKPTGELINHEVVSAMITALCDIIFQRPRSALDPEAERRATRGAATRDVRPRAAFYAVYTHIDADRTGKTRAKLEGLANVVLLNGNVNALGVLEKPLAAVVDNFLSSKNAAQNTLQRSVLKAVYGLSGADAKEVASRMGLATCVHSQNAVFHSRKPWLIAWYRARDKESEAQSALASLKASVTAASSPGARSRLADAQALVDRLTNELKAALDAVHAKIVIKPADALDVLEKTLHARRGKRKRPGSEVEEDAPPVAGNDPKSFTPRQCFRAEAAHQTAGLTQLEQALYRASLMRRLGAALGKTADELELAEDDLKRRHGKSLAPVCGIGRRLVALQRPALAKLVFGRTEFWIAENHPDMDTQDLIRMVLTPAGLKATLGTSPHARLSPSFRTDGYAAHMAVCNDAHLRGIKAKTKAAVATKRAQAKGSVFECDLDDEDELQEAADAGVDLKPLPSLAVQNLPAGAQPVGIDLGNDNILTAATLEALLMAQPPKVPKTEWCNRKRAYGRGPLLEGKQKNHKLAPVVVVSKGEWDHNTGLSTRKRTLQKQLRRERENNPAFVAGEAALKAADLTKDSPIELSNQLHAREHAAWIVKQLFDIPSRALSRLHATLAEEGEYRRVVLRIAPTPLHYLVIGSGHNAGRAARFLRTARLMLGPARIVMLDEFRSSQVDPNTHELMFTQACVKLDKNGERCIVRPWGQKQSTSDEVLPGGQRYNMRWHRDVVAAINILRLFYHLLVHKQLPTAFKRSTDKDTLVQSRACRRVYELVEGGMQRGDRD